MALFRRDDVCAWVFASLCIVFVEWGMNLVQGEIDHLILLLSDLSHHRFLRTMCCNHVVHLPMCRIQYHWRYLGIAGMFILSGDQYIQRENVRVVNQHTLVRPEGGAVDTFVTTRT